MVSSGPDVRRHVRIGELVRGRVHADLSGSLDLANADLVADRLRGVLGCSRPQVLTLDMSAVNFCDCAALGVLVSVHEEGQRQGTRVVISAASPEVTWLLRFFGLEPLFAYSAGGSVIGDSSG